MRSFGRFCYLLSRFFRRHRGCMRQKSAQNLPKISSKPHITLPLKQTLSVCFNGMLKKGLSKLGLALGLLAVSVYQACLRPALLLFTGSPPSVCRFWPSCSEYCKQALRQHGLFRGAMRSVRRLLRCHPWTTGGLDPP